MVYLVVCTCSYSTQHHVSDAAWSVDLPHAGRDPALRQLQDCGGRTHCRLPNELRSVSLAVFTLRILFLCIRCFRVSVHRIWLVITDRVIPGITVSLGQNYHSPEWKKCINHRPRNHIFSGYGIICFIAISGGKKLDGFGRCRSRCGCSQSLGSSFC